MARDPWGGPVVIENQLEATDHTHLGQAIAYVAGVDRAATVIWVATRIRPEHAAALRWLNTCTPEHIGFYGVEIATWTINGSTPGYQFNVIVRPDTHSPSGSGKARGPLTEEQVVLQAYWAAFRDFLDERGAEHWIRPELPRGGWWGRNLGRPGFNLYAVAKPKVESLAVMLEISSQDHEVVFAALAAEKMAIETAFGQSLGWTNTGARDYVTIERKMVNLGDRADWPDQHNWLLTQLEQFRQTFRDRIAELPSITAADNAATAEDVNTATSDDA